LGFGYSITKGKEHNCDLPTHFNKFIGEIVNYEMFFSFL